MITNHSIYPHPLAMNHWQQQSCRLAVRLELQRRYIREVEDGFAGRLARLVGAQTP